MDYNLQNYKGFIFDLDGTLINSMPFHIRAWQQVGKSYGFTVSEDDINTMTGSSGLDIAKYLKDKGNNIPDLKEFVTKKIALYQSNIDKIEVFEDIKDILLKGRADNKKIAIGTGSRNINARTVLEKKGLLNLIDVLITAEDVVVHKPDPETFLKAAKALNLRPDECIVFEDGNLGVKAAYAGGFDCIEVKENKIVAFHKAR